MSLIELMVATVIIVIVASAAVPSMKWLLERKSTAALGDYFVKSIKLARVEAIQRGKTIRVITQSGSGDWSRGWRLEFTNDDDPNNIFNELIREFPALPGAIQPGEPIPPNAINFTSNIYDGTPVLSIEPTGQVKTPGGFDLFYTDCKGNEHLTFEVLLSGLIKRGRQAC